MGLRGTGVVAVDHFLFKLQQQYEAEELALIVSTGGKCEPRLSDLPNQKSLMVGLCS